MPKVLISINTAWNIANFREGLLRALVRQGYEVVAAAPPDGHENAIVGMGCRFVPLRMDNKGTSPTRDAALFVQYLRLMRRERPDVFLGYTIKPNIYGTVAAAAVSIPTINTVTGLGTAFIKQGWLNRLARQMYGFSFGYSQKVFFQNTDDQALFLEGKLVASAKTGVLAGSGVDLDRFRPSAVNRPGDRPICFLMIARLLWDKGVAEFVEAARLVKKIVSDARFVLLGFLDVENPTAVPRQDVNDWVRRGLIEYVEAVADVRPHIADSDCVVLPSYREGTPRTLLEAAAMAKPLIASDVPGCRQVVLDGTNGYLCRARDPKDLAEKMLAFIAMSHEERFAMQQASRRHVEVNYNETLVVDQYLQTIEALISGRPTNIGRMRQSRRNDAC